MKRIFPILLLIIFSQIILLAQSPKRDVRAVWLSTVWRLDWPSTTVPVATGDNEAVRETARNTQKAGLITILDKLEAANFNTVFFQVRGVSDAFYNSKYEPWSQYLSSARGSDPGWDPLAYIIQEAHKRGIEVHAWLNPYRYSTSADNHGNAPTDYAMARPSWLMDYGSYTKILNPGMPEVRTRICDVVEDIITKYDVDGIVFDDYFYVSGTSDNMDNTQYQLYGNGMDRADWRRENVNQMVREVYARINSVKPYLPFGISPAGVAASSPAVAEKYGVEPSPGSDWQYSSIFSDPLAWISDNSIDYISPQLYSGVVGNNYLKFTSWWSKVSNKFGRYYFSSNTSAYTYASTVLPGQVQDNRIADLNGASGAVYFRTNDLTTTAMNGLKGNVYQNPALTAAYGWKVAPMQTLVDNLALSGQNLNWTYGDDNVRYTIYAVPNANRNDAAAFTSTKYLQGVSYLKSYVLANGISSSTHKIAVAVYDRYGNEYPVRILGESASSLTSLQLIYPADNQENMVLPTLFSWNSNGADYYVWELAKDAAFTQPVVSRETEKPEFNSGLQSNIKESTNYYWRVKALKANASVVVSEVRIFNGSKFRITSPANATEKVSMTPEISWTSIGAGAVYTLEISTVSDFGSLIYTVNVQSTTITVPNATLATSTTYYVRVKAELGVIQAISERIYFVTEDVPVPVPVLISPIDGATIHGTEIELRWEAQDSKGFRAELSQTSTFPSRSTTVKSVDPYIYTTVYNGLDAGTYYVRVKAKDGEGLSEPSNVAMIYLTGTSAVPEFDALDFCYSYCDAGNCYLVINNVESSLASVDIYSVTGMLLHKQTYNLNAGKNILPLEIAHYGGGFYLIKVNAGNKEKAMKVLTP